MALLSPGYFPAKYFPSKYWPEDYWPDYGTAVIVVVDRYYEGVGGGTGFEKPSFRYIQEKFKQKSIKDQLPSDISQKNQNVTEFIILIVTSGILDS